MQRHWHVGPKSASALDDHAGGRAGTGEGAGEIAGERRRFAQAGRKAHLFGLHLDEFGDDRGRRCHHETISKLENAGIFKAGEIRQPAHEPVVALAPGNGWKWNVRLRVGRSKINSPQIRRLSPSAVVSGSVGDQTVTV